jgi:internalin A
MSRIDAMAVAKARIAEEAERRTGFLDLSDLALDALPKELASLTALQQLHCFNTQVSDLTPLASLTTLQELDCSYTEI